MSTYKYFRIYKNLDAARHDDTIVSPNVSLIESGSKILHFDAHVRNEELLVIGDSLADAKVVKKYIADETSNFELIKLAKRFGWINPNDTKMSVIQAMAVTTVNDKNGYSLLSDSGLTSFDEFEYFTGVTVCPGYNTGSDIPSLPSTCTSIKLPDSIESIGDWAFCECSGLNSIEISNSVTSIGERAFSNCISLTSITIPDGVTRIGDQAFVSSGLTGELVIPNSVRVIGVHTFEKCGLTSVTIGNDVRQIKEGAFYNCGSLTSITFTGTSTQWRAIVRGTDWHYNVPATTVYCEGDGVTVSLDAV